MLSVENLTVCYGSSKIVDNLSFSVAEGSWLMIIGPNGAGKSTVLNAITQGVPYTGSVCLNGTDIRKMKPALRARDVGVLAQNHFVGYDFTVEEVVRLGRYAYSRSMFAGRSDDDDDAVDAALEQTGLAPQRHQSVLTLSGGELQRTFLAQVFAQSPRLLLLDEPTNHLDLVYQKQVFTLIEDWLKTPGRAVVSVVHDLSLAKSFGSEALLMDHGRAVARGNVSDVLRPAHLDPVYRIDVFDWMRRMLRQWED